LGRKGRGTEGREGVRRDEKGEGGCGREREHRERVREGSTWIFVPGPRVPSNATGGTDC